MNILDKIKSFFKPKVDKNTCNFLVRRKRMHCIHLKKPAMVYCCTAGGEIWFETNAHHKHLQKYCMNPETAKNCPRLIQYYEYISLRKKRKYIGSFLIFLFLTNVVMWLPLLGIISVNEWGKILTGELIAGIISIISGWKVL